MCGKGSEKYKSLIRINVRVLFEKCMDSWEVIGYKSIADSILK